MSQINIKGFINNIKSKSNVYTAIAEAVVNSIQSIEETTRKDGKVIIIIKRSDQKEINFENSDEEKLSDIESIEVIDNGIGFNAKNEQSFDTLNSDLKEKIGGKGFGRFMYLKHFREVKIESTYRENEMYKKIKFNFGTNNKFIDDRIISTTAEKDTQTKLFLTNIKNNKLDKKIDTIARKLVEKLLIYFIQDDYQCPIIEIIDADDRTSNIVLNEYLKSPSSPEIKELHSEEFVLDNHQENYKFQVKVFKIFYPNNQKSKICLTADKREVVDEVLHKYIPEFNDEFIDKFEKDSENQPKKYFIKTYVISEYLNNNVSLEREGFNFSEKDLMHPFSREQIEFEAAKISSKILSDEIITRKEQKREKVEEYVNEHAPWHKPYINEINIDNMEYNLQTDQIEYFLQKEKFKRETTTKHEIQSFLKDDSKNSTQKFDNLVQTITDIGKSDLAHYICNRKIILDLIQKSLERDEDGSAKLEKEFHDIIYPMNKDSTNTEYKDHNLWILDERLVFSEYIASDRKINKATSKTKPDLVIFDKKQSFRNGENEFSSPLTIFEFKRPKRINYKAEDDPILQIAGYLKEIRQGKYEIPNGVEKIKINDNTPVYAFIICDLTDKIVQFCINNQLVESPDKEGYFGFHAGFKMYIQVISFKKLLNDANLRNKIFFSKLGLE